MKKYSLAKFALIATLISGMTAFTATPSNAVDQVFNALVNILEPLAINDVDDLDFGKIQAPSTGSPQTFTVDPNTGNCNEGAGDGLCLGGSDNGALDVTGSNGEGVEVSAVAGACTGVGATTLTDITFVPSSGPADLINVLIGGEITVPVGAEGDGSCAYTVTANYTAP